MKKFGGDTDDSLLICYRRECEKSDIQMLNSSHNESSYNRKKTAIILNKEDVLLIGEESSDTSYYSKVILYIKTKFESKKKHLNSKSWLLE